MAWLHPITYFTIWATDKSDTAVMHYDQVATDHKAGAWSANAKLIIILFIINSTVDSG